MIDVNELDYAKELAQKLKKFGEVSLYYITAEFQPFSSQFKPDVVLIRKNKNAKKSFSFFEVRTNEVNEYDNHQTNMVIEHKKFAEEALELDELNYFLITTSSVSEVHRKILEKKSIIVIDEIKGVEIDAKRIENLIMLE